MSDEASIAVLGLGLIGSIWARHYHAAGRLGAAWSRSPKPELPFAAGTLEDCAAQAAFLHLCLFDAASVREVLDRLAPLLGAGHTVIQSSTIDAASAEEFAARVRATGARYIEAPFTGSKPAAEERKTVFFLGGGSEDIAAAGPLLELVSATRFHIGTPAQAATIKLAMNLQIACLCEALCESLTLARRAGIGDDSFFEVMKQNAAWSGLSALKEPKLRAGDFSPQFSVRNMHKDMRLAAATAEQPPPLLEAVRRCLEKTEQAGHGDDDFLSLIRVLEP